MGPPVTCASCLLYWSSSQAKPALLTCAGRCDTRRLPQLLNPLSNPPGQRCDVPACSYKVSAPVGWFCRRAESLRGATVPTDLRRMGILERVLCQVWDLCFLQKRFSYLQVLRQFLNTWLSASCPRLLSCKMDCRCAGKVGVNGQLKCQTVEGLALALCTWEMCLVIPAVASFYPSCR